MKNKKAPTAVCGILVGAVGTVARLATGGLLLPLIGMTGLPLAAEKFVEVLMEKLQPDIIYLVENQINDLIDALQQHKNSKRIMHISIEEFRKLLRSIHEMMDAEIAARTNDKEMLLI